MSIRYAAGEEFCGGCWKDLELEKLGTQDCGACVSEQAEKTAENEADTTGFNNELYETVLTDMFGDLDVR